MGAAVDVQDVPLTVAASVRYRTACVMSLTVEGRPIGDRLTSNLDHGDDQVGQKSASGTMR